MFHKVFETGRLSSDSDCRTFVYYLYSTRINTENVA